MTYSAIVLQYRRDEIRRRRDAYRRDRMRPFNRIIDEAMERIRVLIMFRLYDYAMREALGED